jgi:hypothetical protein
MGGKILQNRSSRLKIANKKNDYIPHRREKPFLKSGKKKNKEGRKIKLKINEKCKGFFNFFLFLPDVREFEAVYC